MKYEYWKFKPRRKRIVQKKTGKISYVIRKVRDKKMKEIFKALSDLKRVDIINILSVTTMVLYQVFVNGVFGQEALSYTQQIHQGFQCIGAYVTTFAILWLACKFYNWLCELFNFFRKDKP